MGNYHVPFWRAVEEATPSLTLIILAAGLAVLPMGKAPSVKVCGANVRPDRHESIGQLQKTSNRGRKQKPKS